MDRCRIHRSASRLSRTHDSNRNGAGAGTVLRTCLRVPRQARRSDQVIVVGWRRAVSISEAAGARTLRLAAGHERNRGADAGAVVDAFGRH